MNPWAAEAAGRWQRFWGSLDRTPVPDFKSVQAAYQEKGRFYHTFQHLVECLRAWEREGSSDPVVEAAIWGHDLVYDPRRQDNESRSVDRWLPQLVVLGFPAALAAEVGPLILATRHQVPPVGERQALVVDIDLGIFAADRLRLLEYDGQIRQEYAWVPDEEFRRGRLAVLRRFFDRPAIYFHPRFSLRWEATARDNLAFLIAHHAALDPSQPRLR